MVSERIRYFATSLAVTLVIVHADEEGSACRLWLGPSSTSTEENPVFGLFAGVDFDKDELIPDSEIAIPLFDWSESYHRVDDFTSRIIDFVESQVWTGDYAGARFESTENTVVAIPGVGVSANYHSGKFNVDWEQRAVLQREKEMYPYAGEAHLSRGAITPYYNLTMKAVEPIKAGMELFANFGETWDNPNNNDAFQDKITRDDYEQADKVLDAILDFMTTYEVDLNPELKDDILDFMLEQVLGAAAGRNAKVIRSLIPAHPGKLQRVKDAGGTFNYRYEEDALKSQKWLERHAICVDNLKSGPSTIPEAGRGAFATRRIAKGDIVAPSPMIHIANEDILNMYNMFESQGEDGETYYELDKSNGPTGNHLMLNYCFGHRESTLLLLPTGPKVNLINHASKGRQPNAYITWSRHKYVGNDHSLHDITVSELGQFTQTNIVMNVVALRDIEEGEEIFINYGDDWEAAWIEYETNWKQRFGKDLTWPMKASDMKEQYKNIPYPANQRQGTFPPGVATVCFLETGEVDDGTPRVNSAGQEIIKYIGTPETVYSGTQMFICDIIARSEKLDDGNFYNYTVLANTQDDTIVQVINVPHEVVTFVDMPYESDIHIQGAFRHWIEVPDADWPQSWRDLRNA